MIGIAGHNTSVAQEFMSLLPGETFVREYLADMPLTLGRYLICAGFLAGRSLSEINGEDAFRTWATNFLEPARFCERLFLQNANARVCVIGSESGEVGSYDMAYAGAKAAMHLYVRTKKLTSPMQQLNAISPCIIRDSGMTQRRTDHAKMEARAAAQRHGRWLEAREVAALARDVLCNATPFLSNTVLRLQESKL
jgi:NAD(P)-dependent dehydrogenase (short-subunit alcohol dehydrogenase family)